MTDVIARLARKLIVSSQAMNPLSPLRAPETLSLLAQAAALGGAGGHRPSLAQSGVAPRRRQRRRVVTQRSRS